MSYRVILADPPWLGGATQFHRQKQSRRPIIDHYPTLALREIAALPVATLAGENAVLFLWTTNTMLPQALHLMSAWGFEYVTVAFAWVKLQRDGKVRRPGLGAYTKQNVELCLLGKRGTPSRQRKARDVHQVIASIPRAHSRKPDEQYDRIMRLFDGPYLELFARQQWPGWDIWGNQAGKFAAQPFLFGEFAS